MLAVFYNPFKSDDLVESIFVTADLILPLFPKAIGAFHKPLVGLQPVPFFSFWTPFRGTPQGNFLGRDYILKPLFILCGRVTIILLLLTSTPLCDIYQYHDKGRFEG